MTDSKDYFYINLEKEKKRIIKKIRDMEMESIKSQSENHERLKA